MNMRDCDRDVFRFSFSSLEYFEERKQKERVFKKKALSSLLASFVSLSLCTYGISFLSISLSLSFLGLSSSSSSSSSYSSEPREKERDKETKRERIRFFETFSFPGEEEDFQEIKK